MPRPTKNHGFDDTPLWNHVDVLHMSAGRGGNRKWRCKYCNKEVSGSYSKAKGHLLKIPNQGVLPCTMVDDIYREIKKENDEAEQKKRARNLSAKQKQDYISLPEGSDLAHTKKRKGGIENPYYRKFCQRLANGSLYGYIPPTYDRLRTTLLLQLKAHVEKLLQPIRDSWVKKGASICLDGWQDLKSKPLINIMAASASSPVFLKAFDASEIITKVAEYLAGFEKADHYKECQWILDLVNQVDEINYFVQNHGLSKQIFDRYSDLRLLKVAETRFGSKIVMASRLRFVKDALEKTVMDPDWKKFKVNGRTPVELKAREVKVLLVSDGWWDKLDYFLEFTLPMINFLKAADTDSCVLHLVYDMWDTMIEQVKKVIFNHEGAGFLTEQSPFYDAIQNVIEIRAVRDCV
ncbi:hypothetical protein CTI12_AA570610 [Artemisia annua]|uniref:DUF659 domain-containing protein n=1 Tax=Artemisia annua TaxID=35608 RepID=A0A2U1KPI9_ARTAN|nr:hypothetical protein CTI12_AA570610 [Artemisia annua]